MSTDLFDSESHSPLAAQLAPKLHALAEHGVYFGTSSWKYPGWVGSIYSHDRYVTNMKFSNAKFERSCLSEYAATFPTVGCDFSFYQFPSPDAWAKQFAGAPKDFSFGLMVPETVTVTRWPGHARYRQRAGQDNAEFSNANLFENALLGALRTYKNQVAACIFEFGTFAKKDFETPAVFFGRLRGFLGSMLKG